MYFSGSSTNRNVNLSRSRKGRGKDDENPSGQRDFVEKVQQERQYASSAYFLAQILVNFF
jgi:hypothetical protein